jgi:uncharacterized protein YbjQ (UPF0145 family)
MIQFGVFLSLLLIGYVFGRMNEAKHFADLDKREAAMAHMVLSDLRSIPKEMTSSKFVSGNVVVSVDYYKQVAAALRTLVGGEIKSYQTLLTRARREAVLRMVEQAEADGARFIANIRLETSSVFQNAQNIGSLEVHAYGTALK